MKWIALLLLAWATDSSACAHQVLQRATHTPIAQGNGWTSVLETTRYKMAGLDVEKSRVVVSRAPGWKLDNAERFRKNYLDRIRENVEFAIEHYQRRKWPESFKDELRKTAIEYADDSTYFTFRDDGKIVGTFRFISTRSHQKKSGAPSAVDKVGGTWTREALRPAVQQTVAWRVLPVEKALDISLERPVFRTTAMPSQGPGILGETIEPGNLAIAEHLNPQTYRAVLTEMISSIYDPLDSADFNAHGKILYSYADLRGKKLYTPMGWEIIDEAHPISHAGIDWWPMRMTPERLKLWLEHVARRPNFDASQAAWLREMTDVFNTPVPSSNRTQFADPKMINAAEVRDRMAQTRSTENAKFKADWEKLVGETGLTEAQSNALRAPYAELIDQLTIDELQGNPLLDSFQGAKLTMQYAGGVPQGILIYDGYGLGNSVPTHEQVVAAHGPLWEVLYHVRRKEFARQPHRPVTEIVADVRKAAIQSAKNRALNHQLNQNPKQSNLQLLQEYHRITAGN